MPSFSLAMFPVIIVALYLLSSIKILAEYRARSDFSSWPTVGRSPKVQAQFLSFRPLDRMVRVFLRQEALRPAQDTITRDNVTLKVNAVIFVRVIDPNRAVEKLNTRIQSILDQHAAPCRVKVVNVEVQQVDMLETMLLVMAKQGSRTREALEDHSRRRGVCRCTATLRGSSRHGSGAAQYPASLFAGLDRDWCGKEHDCGLPTSHRSDLRHWRIIAQAGSTEW